MRVICLAFVFSAIAAIAQQKEFVGKEQPGAALEHFTLKGGRTYDGIWDPAKSEIHIVNKTNHVGNLSVSSDEILTRKNLGDASQVKLYSDVDMAEKVLLLHMQNYRTAQARQATASQRVNNLHQTYGHQNLPTATYNAVMAQYKAADEELANAQKSVDLARAGFSKALEAYQKAGGKTAYQLP